MGLKPTEIIDGYEIAANKVLDEILPQLTVHEIKDIKNLSEVTKAIRSSVMSKQYGNEDFLAQLIAKACISVANPGVAFNVDSVRVCKILGSGVDKSQVIQGMVFKKLVIIAINTSICITFSFIVRSKEMWYHLNRQKWLFSPVQSILRQLKRKELF